MNPPLLLKQQGGKSVEMDQGAVPDQFAMPVCKKHRIIYPSGMAILEVPEGTGCAICCALLNLQEE